jgi:small subunit ribosomal protein S16
LFAIKKLALFGIICYNLFNRQEKFKEKEKMLVIRLQRFGRKFSPIYRLAVQDSHRHPSSGRVVTFVGTWDPHTKTANLDKEKIETFLKNGAQPSGRAAKMIQDAGIALPSWVKAPNLEKKRAIRKPEKLRKNQPKEEAPVEEAASAPAESEVEAESVATEVAEAAEAATEEAEK